MGKDSLGEFSLSLARTFDQYIADADDATNPSFVEWRKRVMKKKRDRRYRTKKRQQSQRD